jgi:transposase-like protein
MGRRPRVDRTPEQRSQIVQEGIKSGNVSETCRGHGISPSLFPDVRRALAAGQSSRSRTSFPQPSPHPLLAQRTGHPA